MKLKNKVAIVTGSALGIGKSEAELFAKEGAKVVVSDILDEEGEKVAEGIKKNGGDCFYAHLDISNAKDWDDVVSRTLSEYGQIDILLNNATVFGPSNNPMGTNQDLSEEDWNKVMEINVKGIFLGTKRCIPEMIKNKKGSIINTCSSSATFGQLGVVPVYNASKGAIRSYTRSLAVEYGSEGIRVNSISPGPIKTRMNLELIKNEGTSERIQKRVALRRAGDPIEVAQGAVFLASDDASFVTGADLVIDGGLTIHG
tara:strand:+ start:2158 stop:2928 length:771 start_codon:yes stop_codon:yes gene_type:complete